MHHVALDRAGPHDRDLDDEIVEGARFQARQHVHLRAAFDLEHAERLAPLQHLVNFVVVLRLDVGQLVSLPLVVGDQVEAFADAGQHAQRQHIDLHHAQRVDVVLVPFDEGAVVHRGVADRHIGIEPILRQHIAADMLRQVSWKLDQLGGERDRKLDHRIRRVESGLADLHLVETLAPASPHGIGERGGDVLGQTQRLADIADRGSRPIMDDGGNDRGAVAAVAAVDILHHLLAPRMLEIDVDVGRLQPLLGNEALEQQVDLGRVDRGDAEHVADRGVRRRSPTLAEDVLAAGILHDVVHGEEIMRVFQFVDQREFLVQGGAKRVGDIVAEIFVDAGPGQVFEVLLRGLARRHRFVRILVLELVERKADARSKTHGLRNRLGQVAKQPRHFVPRLQVALGIGFEPPADGVDGGFFANTGQHVLQRTAGGMVIQHLVGRQQRHFRSERDAMQSGQPTPVVAAVEQACAEPDAVGAGAPQPLQDCLRLRRVEAVRQRQHQQLALGEFHEVIELQMALTFLDPRDVVAALAAGQQLAELAIGGAVARIDQDVGRAVDEDEARADQKLGLVRNLGIIELLVRAHHAGQRVVVGNADRSNAEFAGLLHIGARIRAAAQEREIGGDADLGITRR